MGLDMYLSRYTTKGYDIATINAVEGYLDLEDYKAAHPGYECTLYDWCHADEALVTPEALAALKPLYTEKYYYWDVARRHPHKMLYEPVGYWRKENHIHKWFVDNVQDGNDNCDMYIVSREQLEALRDVCKKVLEVVRLKDGVIQTGIRYTQENGHEVMTEPGKVVDNKEACAELLPTCNGFFFGDDSYDEYYIHGVEKTVEIINNVLETTDFNTQTITYCSSW